MQRPIDGDFGDLTKQMRDTDVLARVVERIGAWIQDDDIDRARLESALKDARAGQDVRSALLALLADAGITVSGEPLPSMVDSTQAHSSDAELAGRNAAAIAAARRRLELDRGVRRLDKRLLTAEEEVGLSILLRGARDVALEKGAFGGLAGEARLAAEAMVLHNVRLVHKIALRYGGQGLEHDDLVQSGMLGLIRAVELFDPHAGFKFSTYATWWIRQGITRAVADFGRVVRLPVHLHETIQKVRAAQQRLAVDNLSPSPAMLAVECDLSVEKVIACLRLSRSAASLDDVIGDDGFTLGDLVDQQADKPEHVEVNGYYPEDVWAWLELLSERERDVMLRRYGLAPYEDQQTLEVIGRSYGLTRERVRQIQEKAFEHLRSIADSVRHEADCRSA